jgi:hypothetical protein
MSSEQSMTCLEAIDAPSAVELSSYGRKQLEEARVLEMRVPAEKKTRSSSSWTKAPA